ncbi:hypothetical protein [Xenorhabdus mauleonii]|uniref:hypothetical protein n=1 Tax=Xenorhabdus mauleonii TaxID=351675 RepID=UPI000C05641E|nr:hypothetical protein [Xenorhabdus mauleonii]
MRRDSLAAQGSRGGVKGATAGRSAKERPTGVNANGRGYGLDDGTPCASVCHGARNTAPSCDARGIHQNVPFGSKEAGLARNPLSPASPDGQAARPQNVDAASDPFSGVQLAATQRNNQQEGMRTGEDTNLMTVYPVPLKSHGAKSTALNSVPRKNTKMLSLSVKRPGLPGILQSCIFCMNEQ